MNILKSQEVWMRNILSMNDYMEVRQGLQCLNRAYNGDVGKQFQSALNALFDNLFEEITELFRVWIPYIENDTYIACLSEHSICEDEHGLLSMWRAYGKSTGVALVLNNTSILSDSSPLGVYSSPVAYLRETEFENELAKIVRGTRNNETFLREQGRQTIIHYVFNVFRSAALCIKHPGFDEEREWRVIYTPRVDKSPYVEKSIEVVSGAPEPIYKVPLKNLPDIGYSGLEIPKLLDRIIIGPTKYPLVVSEAFTTLLSAVGMNNPASRVHVSDIPLRV